jgi:hypothetical protein
VTALGQSTVCRSTLTFNLLKIRGGSPSSDIAACQHGTIARQIDGGGGITDQANRWFDVTRYF